jgi:GTP-binding protein
MAFVDEARIFVRSGSGGKGCRSFYRDKYGRHPKPNGGDGGKGADIVFCVDSNIHTLLDFQFHQHFIGEHGGHGGANNKKGKAAKALIIKVALGTVIKDLGTGCVLRDLAFPNESVIVAEGGQGGKGNANSKEVIPPKPGEEKHLLLELKLIADCGIIGFPNVGKSTLINALSAAKSKIADYPFTTKDPVLGVVKGDSCDFVVADLPGLIEGAHEGKGLGCKFLKHVERTRILIHLLDMSGFGGRSPLEDFHKLNQELKFFNPDLSQKTQFVVANKMDLPQAPENLKRFKEKFKGKIFPISAKNKQGLGALVTALRKKICKENLIRESNA